jgi:hypothetical protein
MWQLDVTPHVAQNDKCRRSAIDGRTTRHAGYEVSLRVRKRIEEVFGWMKTVGGQRKTRYRGTARARIEQAIGKLKRFKRVAMRCEKTDISYSAIISFACGLMLVKSVHTA